MHATRDWYHQPAARKERIVCQTLLEGMGPLEPLALRHDPRSIRSPQIQQGPQQGGPRFARFTTLLGLISAFMALKH